MLFPKRMGSVRKERRGRWPETRCHTHPPTHTHTDTDTDTDTHTQTQTHRHTQIRKEEGKKQGLLWMDKIMHHLRKTLAAVFA